tara:strand:+ start:475 stop:1401 length:927 start_codon:yes stop_codon:yes gene_type:complete
LFKKYLYIIIFICFTFPALAVEKKIIEDENKRVELLEKLNWKNLYNPKAHLLNIAKANVSIAIVETEYYLDSWDDINQYRWWTFGYGAYSDEVAMIRGEDYTIYVSWIDDGYVKIEDWKNVNPKELLNSLNEISKSNEQWAKDNNVSYSTNISWIYEPSLNETKKVVNYSYKVKWSDGVITMESKSLKLGKKGYIESAFVSFVDQNTDFTQKAESSKIFAEYIEFDENFRHSDYKSGDKVAAMGIGGLVAGTLGVKALAKAGAFAKLIPLLLKFGWILLIPLAFVGKLFGGKDRSTVSQTKKSKKKKN